MACGGNLATGVLRSRGRGDNKRASWLGQKPGSSVELVCQARPMQTSLRTPGECPGLCLGLSPDPSESSS